MRGVEARFGSIVATTAPAAAGAVAGRVIAQIQPFIRRDEGHRYRVRARGSRGGRWCPTPAVSRILEHLHSRPLTTWGLRRQYEADIEAAWDLFTTGKREWPRWKFEAIFQHIVGSRPAAEAALDEAARHGTEVHRLIEAELVGAAPRPEAATAAARAGVERFRAWWASAGLTVVAVEQAVAYFEGGRPLYAGTFDLLARRGDGRLVLIDFKTGYVGPSDKQIFQSVAYRHALAQMGVPVPVAGMLVRVPRCATSPIETFDLADQTESAFQCFLALCRLNTWRNTREHKPHAVGASEEAA